MKYKILATLALVAVSAEGFGYCFLHPHDAGTGVVIFAPIGILAAIMLIWGK